MKKSTIRVDIWPQTFTVRMEGRIRNWLFSRLFTVKITDKNQNVDILKREIPKQRPGRVVAISHDAEAPRTKKNGGRVTKVLPRQIKKMKRAQVNVKV